MKQKEKTKNINQDIWPVVEAKRILNKINWETQSKGFVLFETGYGPSGLPHIGTFSEVVRTSFVIYAFHLLAPDIKTKLLVISDDFDGMRSIPDNIPQKDTLKQHINKPLADIPSPFLSNDGSDEGKTYGEFMNNKLCAFLDLFGFEYEFLSASKAYRSGQFNKHLIVAAKKYQELTKIMLPTLGTERKKTYSPFLPFDKETGTLLTEGVISVDPDSELIKFYNSKGKIVEQKFTSGGCKLQWKCDFGMRWAALDVDYEIYGKDHYPNEKIYQSICKVLGGKGPVNFFYELFLDNKGGKISKSKGNGVTVQDWMDCANKDVLSLYMFQKPKTAKKLTADIILRTFDEYLNLLSKFKQMTLQEQTNSPIFFIHRDKKLPNDPMISFNLLVNLVSICSTANKVAKEDVIWLFLKRYNPALTRNSNTLLDQMIIGAINYYSKFIFVNKSYAIPNELEVKLLQLLKEALVNIQKIAKVERDEMCQKIQNAIYAIATENNIKQAEWFSMLYKLLLGTENGPRMGSFIALYGIKETIDLIDKALLSCNLLTS